MSRNHKVNQKLAYALRELDKLNPQIEDARRTYMTRMYYNKARKFLLLAIQANSFKIKNMKTYKIEPE